jgi:hypothetical protein
MGQVKCHGSRRGADVQHGDGPLQFVMSGLVEQVAEPNHANGFAREIDCKSRGTAAEHPGHRVQLLAPTAQVVPGDNEISSAEGGACRKQKAIFPIPKSMLAGRFRKSYRLECVHHQGRCHRSGLNCVGVQ